MSNRKRISLALVALLALMAILWGVYTIAKPQSSLGEKAYSLTVTNDLGEITEYQARTDAAYVGEALRELNGTQGFTMEGTDSEFGYFLTQVNGLLADYATNGAYWAFYLNGAYANFGIDAQPLTDGDAIELRFEQ